MSKTSSLELERKDIKGESGFTQVTKEPQALS